MNTGNRNHCAQPIPGAWYCPKCGFEQFQNILHAQTGNVSVDTTVADMACPNDGELMLQQTCDFRLRSMAAALETQIKRAVRAEDRATKLFEAVEAIGFYCSGNPLSKEQADDLSRRCLMVLAEVRV